MNEDSSLGSVYVGVLTTAIEALTELAHSQVDEDDDSPAAVKEVNTVRFQAVLDLVSVANQIRNHARLDDILADKELAVAYFAAGKPLNQ